MEANLIALIVPTVAWLSVVVFAIGLKAGGWHDDDSVPMLCPAPIEFGVHRMPSKKKEPMT